MLRKKSPYAVGSLTRCKPIAVALTEGDPGDSSAGEHEQQGALKKCLTVYDVIAYGVGSTVPKQNKNIK
jgi:hypothetical protein